jgi:acetyl-CoA carboxylase biotin carboxyl carrier protein
MNLKEVEELIRFVSKANISEVELETKEVKLIIKTGKGNSEQHAETHFIATNQAPPVTAVSAAPVIKTAPVQHSVPETPRAEAKGKDESQYVTIKSPMIGTFYRSPSPDKPPLLNIGDKLEKGKVICIIEAMKLFNEIESEVSGTVVKVLVTDASPVEFDQPLFLVEPN